MSDAEPPAKSNRTAEDIVRAAHRTALNLGLHGTAGFLSPLLEIVLYGGGVARAIAYCERAARGDEDLRLHASTVWARKRLSASKEILEATAAELKKLRPAAEGGAS